MKENLLNLKITSLKFSLNNMADNLKNLGFDKWYLEAATHGNPDNFEVARVVAVHKDSYTVSNGEVDTIAELIGKILFNASSPLDYPAVGDWVFVNFYDEFASKINASYVYLLGQVYLQQKKIKNKKTVSISKKPTRKKAKSSKK